MSMNHISELAEAVSQAIHEQLWAEQPLSLEELSRLEALLTDLQTAAEEHCDPPPPPPAPDPAPSGEPELANLSYQMDLLFQQQSATRRKINDLIGALSHADRGQGSNLVRSFFSGFGLGLALSPILFLLLFLLCWKAKSSLPYMDDNILLAVTCGAACILLGAVLFLCAWPLAKKVCRWLKQQHTEEDEAL